MPLVLPGSIRRSTMPWLQRLPGMLVLASIWLFAVPVWLFAVPVWRAEAQTTGAPTAGGADRAYAPVVVEGRKILEVSGNAQLSAAARADKINRRLTNLVAQGEAVQPFDFAALMLLLGRQFRICDQIVVGIGYEDAIPRTQQIAQQTARQTEGVLADPAPGVLVDELATSTVNLRVRFYMNSLRADYLRVGSEVMRRVKEAFDREGVSMPTDIQTLVIQNLHEAAQIVAEAKRRKGTESDTEIAA